MRETTSRSHDDVVLQAHLNALQAELSDLPAEQRDDVVADVRAHVADALEEGRPLVRVLAALGPASRYREELGLPPANDGAARRARRTLQVGAAITASITAVFAIVLYVLGAVPWQAGTGVPQATDLPDDVTWGVAVVVLPAALPVLAMASASVVTTAARRRWPGTPGAADRIAVGSAAVVTASLTVDFWATGWLYVPAALLMWAAAVVPRRMRRGPLLRTPVHRRVIRALVVALPGLLMLLGQLATGMPRSPTEPLETALNLAMPVLVLATSVLVGLGLRLAHVALVVVGAVVMVAGMLEGSLLVLAVWWLGGLWIAVGMVALVDGTNPVRLRRHHHAAPAIG